MACELSNFAEIPYIPYITTMPGSRGYAHSSGKKVVLTLVAMAWLWWGSQHLWLKGRVLHAFTGAVGSDLNHCLGEGPAWDEVDSPGYHWVKNVTGAGFRRFCSKCRVVGVWFCCCCVLWFIVVVFGVVVGVCVCMLVGVCGLCVCGRVVVRCRLCGVCMGGGEVHASGAM